MTVHSEVNGLSSITRTLLLERDVFWRDAFKWNLKRNSIHHHCTGMEAEISETNTSKPG